MVVHRSEMRATLSRVISLLRERRPAEPLAEEPVELAAPPPPAPAA